MPLTMSQFIHVLRIQNGVGHDWAPSVSWRRRQEERASAEGVDAAVAQAEAWKQESGRAKQAAAEAQVCSTKPLFFLLNSSK